MNTTAAFAPNLDRIKRDIMTLAEFTSAGEAGYTRISFSEEDHRAREHFALLMEKEANLAVEIDAAGNLIGHRPGKTQGPAILIGSHLDTVRGGGRFDGIAGVVAGLEIARVFEERQIQNRHPLEVVVFVAEEPSPFGISTVGSRAMTAKLSEDLLRSLKDNEGRTLGAAIEAMGGDPANITEAKRSPDNILAYLELHIEQGPVLFSRDIPIGVVTGIVGIYRGKIEVLGRSDHSGTTPMEGREDALVTASEIISAFERICRGLDGVVGTIGKIEAFPNALNVVPGRVILGMDLRSLSEAKADEAIASVRKTLEKIQDERGCSVSFEVEKSSNPIVFNPNIVWQIIKVCERGNISHLEMTSGAGHDANHMAELAPAGMVFIPSRDGRSHCPEEWTEFEDICVGTEVLAETVILIDKEVDT